MAGFSGLTFAVVPVVTGAGALTSGLPAGTVIAGFVDPINGQRIFNPAAEGNAVATGDAYTKWLPTVKAVVATQVTDAYWAPVASALGISETTPTYPTSVGQIKLELSPAAANTVEASSVQTFYLSPQALVITATAGSF